MIGAAELPDTIPVFPLEGAVLLPRARLPLHIFEPRYLTMIEDALKTRQRLIGMIQPRAGGLHQIGCAGRITSFAETDDGRYMITLSGISRFDLGEEQGGFAPYRRFEVNWRDFTADLSQGQTAGLDRAQFLPLLRRYFDQVGLEADWDSLQSAEDELLINSLAMLCPLSAEDKQALVEAPTLTERLNTLKTLIEFACHAGGDDTRLQ